MRHLKYSRQKGGGFFNGARYQRGNGGGFLKAIFKGAVIPALKWFARKGGKSVVNIGQQLLENPSKPMKEIAMDELKNLGTQAVDDGAARVKKFVQTGKGEMNGDGMLGLLYKAINNKRPKKGEMHGDGISNTIKENVRVTKRKPVNRKASKLVNIKPIQKVIKRTVKKKVHNFVKLNGTNTA